MRVVRRLPAGPRPFPEPILAIGNFDGVHLGHRTILDAAARLATTLDSCVVAFTFRPHPVALLAPERAPPQIMSLARRLDALAGVGVAGTVVVPFTRQFSQISADHFVEEILVRRLGVRGIVVGPDLRYGQGRQGNPETLREAGRQAGFEVEIVEPVVVAGERVSSTAVRAALLDGDVERAARLLGRPHQIHGRVRAGDRRGAQLGFPTANLLPRGGLLPPDGVYAVSVRIYGEAGRQSGVANLGTNPTFGGVVRRLEVHLLDFARDLYGCRLEVDFESRLREERCFGSVQDLVVQIGLDVEAARARLGKGADGNRDRDRDRDGDRDGNRDRDAGKGPGPDGGAP